MNIQLSQNPHKGNELLVCFVSKENFGQTRDFLKSAIDSFELSEDASENGRKMLHPFGSFLLCTFGLGEKIDAEILRKTTHKAVGLANELKYEAISLAFLGSENPENVFAITEAAILGNYQFLKYKSDKKNASLQSILIWGKGEALEAAIAEATTVAEVTCIARDLVNEPVITLTAEELANRAAALGEKYGFTVDIFNKSKIQTLKMGGLLAVNSGSQDPPTFSILEYKPENCRNEKPIIFVGKGVVYDTGGLSLKPTLNSMDMMKCDMAGAAAVIGAICGIAALKLNIHVIGLIPATDNRPGENAYTPGDVITMYDGSTVEVLNTDAEGRLILADALAYAKKYEPELVIDLATLTGACVVAIGSVGLGMMSNAEEELKANFKKSGEKVYERLVEFPLWDEYGEMLRSDIADMKNLGGSGAGAITAGKFLEKFTDYPWIHLDIAGAAYLTSPDSYRGKNGTGTGVRLLIDFVRNYKS